MASELQPKCDTLSMHLGQLDDDEREYLDEACIPAFKSLLCHAHSYTPAQTEKHLRIFTECLAFWIRGRRASSLPTAKLPVGAWAPVSLSINFQNSPESRDHVVRTVRFTVEPHKTTSTTMLASLAKLLGEPEMSWTDQIANTLLGLDPSLTAFAGIDCVGSSAKLKTYLSLPKMTGTGLSRNSVILQAVRNLQAGPSLRHPDFAAALDVLEAYLATPEGSRLFLHPIAMDCPDSSRSDNKARIKIYAMLPSCNSWSVLRNVHTLGGRLDLDSDRKKGLDILGSIWDLLRGDPDSDCRYQLCSGVDDDRSKPPRYPRHVVNGLVFSFELLPGRQFPDVKTYVPTYQYAATDRFIAANIARIFDKLGWHQAVQDYPTMLEATFPRTNLDSESTAQTLHDYISFAYSRETGPYVSIYYRERFLSKLR